MNPTANANIFRNNTVPPTTFKKLGELSYIDDFLSLICKHYLKNK